MGRGVDRFLDIIFPSVCASCGADGQIWCDRCRERVTPVVEAHCCSCGGSPILGLLCGSCTADFLIDHIFAAVSYDDEMVERMVWLLKYRSVKEAGQAAAKVMVSYLKKTGWKEVVRADDAVVVPIPLHNRKLRLRGFNQSAVIAEALCELVPRWRYDELLFRNKNGVSQTKADRIERDLNIRGAFVFSGSEVPDTVLLVDDVVTSGSTFFEAAAALKEAGVRRVIGYAFAHRA